jgi:hypothetical protein
MRGIDSRACQFSGPGRQETAPRYQRKGGYRDYLSSQAAGPFDPINGIFHDSIPFGTRAESERVNHLCHARKRAVPKGGQHNQDELRKNRRETPRKPHMGFGIVIALLSIGEKNNDESPTQFVHRHTP